jgi:pimeloyl-ACP methyl ester carboxylesterase
MPTRTVRGAVLALALVATALSGTETAEAATEDAPATRHVTLADGAVIALTVQGSGPPLVFIHGWACNRSHWRNQVPAFAADHTVVALDLPGHGESTGTRASWTLEQYGADVDAGVRQRGLEHVVLVGHSMGGPVALEAARRLGPLVSGVVVVDTLHDVEARMQGKQVDDLRAAYEKDFAGQCAKAMPYMFTKTSDPTLVKWVTEGACATRPEVAVDLFARFPVYDGAAAMKAVSAPIRAINTHWQPTQVEINRKYSPGFDVIVIEGAGHFIQLEAPDRFNEALRRTLESFSATPPSTGAPR